MAYSVKKAGVQFYATVDTGADMTGKANNFSIVIRNNANGDTITGITTGNFIELSESAGTYQVPITIANVGDYTVIISNTTDSLGSITAPVVVTNASIDDINNAVDLVNTTVNNIYSEVQNLDGDSLSSIQQSISNVQVSINTIKDLINNKTATLTFTGANETNNLVVDDTVTGQTSGALGKVMSSTYGTDTVIELTGVIGQFVIGEEISGTGTTTTGLDSAIYSNEVVDSVLEFLNQLDAAINEGSGLGALEGYTDDIENMLLGTEFLADDITPNPFYNATNPGVAKASNIADLLVTLQGNISTAISSVNNYTNSLVGNSTDTTNGTLFGNIYLLKQVVDANKAYLEDSGYGLEALSNLVDDIEIRLGTDTDVTGGNTLFSKIADVNALISDETNGLVAIKTLLNTMDSKLDTISSKVDEVLSGAGARVFI